MLVAYNWELSLRVEPTVKGFLENVVDRTCLNASNRFDIVIREPLSFEADNLRPSSDVVINYSAKGRGREGIRINGNLECGRSKVLGRLGSY